MTKPQPAILDEGKYLFACYRVHVPNDDKFFAVFNQLCDILPEQ